MGVIRKVSLTDKHLTIEQEAYARGRAMGMNQAEAAKAANINVKPATLDKWEKNLAIRNRIQELSAAMAENAILSTGLTREWVIDRLMIVVDRCMQSQPVKDKEGNNTGEWKFDSAGANQALRMLGDTVGLFKPQEKQIGDDLAHLSDDDLVRVALELANSAGVQLQLASAEKVVNGS